VFDGGRVVCVHSNGSGRAAWGRGWMLVGGGMRSACWVVGKAGMGMVCVRG
jgi:hypothetical protein